MSNVLVPQHWMDDIAQDLFDERLVLLIVKALQALNYENALG